MALKSYSLKVILRSVLMVIGFSLGLLLFQNCGRVLSSKENASVDSKLNTLKVQRALWAESLSGASKYTFKYTISCFCPDPREFFVEVDAKTEQVLSVIGYNSDGSVESGVSFDSVFTIQRLFQQIEEDIKSSATYSSVKYNSLGYPEEAASGASDDRIADSELIVEIKELTIVKP